MKNTKEERIERLRKMYWKYVESHMPVAATRTLNRIRELGGTLQTKEES